MEKIIMKVSVREEKGKGACKQIRREGIVPGIVYKGGKKALPVSMDRKELWKALHTDAGENAIITLDIEDGATKTVIAHEIQFDPLRDRVIHVDFQEITLTDVIKVKVPVNVKGEAVGVIEGGVLNQALWEIEVECKAMDVPEHIEVHIEELNIGDGIHIKDLLDIPPEIKIIDDLEELVVGVNAPQVEEEVVEEELEVEEGEEPELIKKGKKEEEEGAAEEEDKETAKKEPAKKEAAKEEDA